VTGIAGGSILGDGRVGLILDVRRFLETGPASEVLSQREFDQITELAYRTCGIDLKNGKQELVQPG